MNKRNIERKRIEQISPTISTGDQIQGNELFMVSARDTNSANGYSTKKMGIQALKDYVLAGITGNNETVVSNGGYEMYDTSENTDGTYSSISEYENSSNNYAWFLEVPRGGTLTKTVTKDCVVWIDGVGGQDDYLYNWTFYINNVKIYTFLFRNNNGARAIYVKRGQELKLETQTYPIKLSVIPLASGGQFFIDTSIAPEQGTLTQNFTYEATRPTLFAHDYVPNVSQTTSAKINGKNVVPMEHGGFSNLCTYFILKTGDTLTTVTSSNAAANYAAYALLMDGSGSGNVSPSTRLQYCKLDGNLGVLGTDISNYSQIAKYEIKFNISSMTTYDHDMFLYHVAQSGFTYEEQFYNWGQYRNVNTNGKKSKFVLYSDNDRGGSIGRQKIILHTMTSNSYNQGTLIGHHLDLSDDSDHTISVIKTGRVECDGVPVDGNLDNDDNHYPNLQDWTIDEPDYLIGGNDYAHGLVGKLYYIKGYNASNELVADLTPRQEGNHIYLHDSVTNTDIEFRGTGSALAPLA